MTSDTTFSRLSLIAFVGACALSLAPSISGQTIGPARQPGPATLIVPENDRPGHVIGRSDLYCAGYIQVSPISVGLEIVGGEKEDERYNYTQGDKIFINAGSKQSMQVGQEFLIIRPRGRFKTSLTRKKGNLGTFTQEVGRARVVELRDNIAIATVSRACDTVLLGDLLVDAPQRISPVIKPEAPLSHFGEANGKQTGRIVLARENRESPARDQIVYIDLGAEDQIKQGDYLTIYRRPGGANITRFREDEIAVDSKGFESDQYKGGIFSNEKRRLKNPNKSSGVTNPSVNERDIKTHRSRVPRRVVGEMVVLNVKERTATAIITRATEEVHTGDSVELQ